MVQIDIHYDGGLRTTATHAPSGQSLITDAPADNHGKGETFSPTDLVATGLGSCILTVMGIVAERHDFDLTGARARVVKHMSVQGERKIDRVQVEIRIPNEPTDRVRIALTKAAHACPVHGTLAGAVEMDISFEWGVSGVLEE